MMSVVKVIQTAQKSMCNASELTLLLRAQLKRTGMPLMSFHTSTQKDRWHKDKVENRQLYRWGYQDKVKQSGALPRISEDSERVRTIKVFRPSNPFAPKEALFGQNDYIDILGNYSFTFDFSVNTRLINVSYRVSSFKRSPLI